MGSQRNSSKFIYSIKYHHKEPNNHLKIKINDQSINKYMLQQNQQNKNFYMILDYSQKFNTALELAQRGQSAKSLKIFQEINQKVKENYCSLVNIGVLYLQQGKMSQAEISLKKATEIDRYQYIAYYNLFILCYELLQNKKISRKSLNNENQSQAISQIYHYLHLTLTCAYVELAETIKDSKLCTKAINLCEQNSAAYACRAHIYELDKKLKLAQNDYTSAICYDPNNHIFYMKRSQFFWRNNRREEASRDIRKYWELKDLRKSHDYNPEKQLLSRQITKDQIIKFDEKIIQKILQLQNVFNRIKQTNQFYDPSELNLATFISGKQPKNQQLSKQSPEKQEKNKSLFIDESSKNISQQIQKLQNQIRLQGGKLLQYQSKQKSISNDQILLTQQIQKTSKQLENIKELPNSSTSITKSNMIAKSNTNSNQRFSTKFINAKQFIKYSKIILQIFNAHLFDQANSSQYTSRINIKYANNENETQFSQSYEWNTKFQFKINQNLHKIYKSQLRDSQGQIQSYNLQQQIQGQILIQLEIKSIGNSNFKKIVGKGHVNIQCLGQNKCIISNDKQKSGIVYYQIKLQ